MNLKNEFEYIKLYALKRIFKKPADHMTRLMGKRAYGKVEFIKRFIPEGLALAIPNANRWRCRFGYDSNFKRTNNHLASMKKKLSSTAGLCKYMKAAQKMLDD